MTTQTSTPLSIVRDLYASSLNLSDDDRPIGEVLLCAYMSNIIHLTKEPVWLQVVGPPSSHKTESLRPFIAYPDTVAVSSLTPNSLLSGHRDKDGNDPSLILHLDGRNLIIKDMTTVHCMDRKSRDKIFGDMRDAFDGFCAKASGISGKTEYKAKFGVIFAITEVIDAYTDQLQQLGERFLTFRTYRYPPTHEQACEYMLHIIAASHTKDQWQQHLRSVVAEQIDILKKRCMGIKTLPTLTDEQLHTMTRMAYMLTYFRTSPVNGLPVSGELPARAIQQLMNMGGTRAVCDLRTAWNEEDICMCRRLVLDTLPAQRRRLVQTLYREATRPPLPYTLEQLAHASRTTAFELKPLVGQYINTGLILADDNYPDRVSRYRLHPKIREFLMETRLFDIGPHLPGKWVKDRFKHQHSTSIERKQA